MNLTERILTLESTIARMASDIDRSRAREAITSGRSPVRIARIVGPVGSSDNTFDIIFIDGTYTETKGQQTPTWDDRQFSAKAVAYNLAGTKVDAGTKVPVYFWGDLWWLWHNTTSSSSDHPLAIVRIDESPGVGSCSPVSRPTDCVWEGYKMAAVISSEMCGGDGSEPYTDDVPIWITDIGHCSPTMSLNKNERYIGYKIGTFTRSGDTRDLYVIRHFDTAESDTGVIVIQGTSDSVIDMTTYCLYSATVEEFKPTATKNNICNNGFLQTKTANVWCADIAKNLHRRKWQRGGQRFIGKRVASSFDVDSDVRELWVIKSEPEEIPAAYYVFGSIAVGAGATTKFTTATRIDDAYPFVWNATDQKIEVQQDCWLVLDLYVTLNGHSSSQIGIEVWPENAATVGNITDHYIRLSSASGTSGLTFSSSRETRIVADAGWDIEIKVYNPSSVAATVTASASLKLVKYVL